MLPLPGPEYLLQGSVCRDPVLTLLGVFANLPGVSALCPDKLQCSSCGQLSTLGSLFKPFLQGAAQHGKLKEGTWFREIPV